MNQVIAFAFLVVVVGVGIGMLIGFAFLKGGKFWVVKK